MDLIQSFQDHWQKEFSGLLCPDSRILVTVSGGVDSVVLLELVAASSLSFEIAHCNFQLRGEESERDESFVRSLGGKYQKEVLVKRFDTKNYATQNTLSLQEAARELRYAWFADLTREWDLELGNHPISSGKHFILTAHHADDNIETMLMHFFRGTGIQGLTGIQPFVREKNLIRPLLHFRKNEIREFAQVKGLSFVEDSSNASDKYTRNYFRNRLLPQIQEVYPQVAENLLQNIQRFTEIDILYRQSVQQFIKKAVVQKGEEWHIPVLKWKKAIPLHTISWEIIKPYGFTAMQTEEVIKLLDAANGAYQASPTHRIIRNRQWMIISPKEAQHTGHILIEKEDTHVLFRDGSLLIKELPAKNLQLNPSSTEACLDASMVQYPLLLRKWKQGDYFYPLGMQKKKKISRFLIDQKLSKSDKEKVWVVESDRKILWVVGYRIDDRFKISPKTKEVLSISYLI